MQNMYHADEQLCSHATVSSRAYVDKPFYILHRRKFKKKEKITCVLNPVFETKCPLKSLMSWERKRDFLEVNKFYVKLCADPLMLLLCILITFTYSAHGPDPRCKLHFSL